MSDVEKVVNADHSSNSEVDALVDPDAGLSDEERAKNVSRTTRQWKTWLQEGDR